jgi:hypothetical protein
MRGTYDAHGRDEKRIRDFSKNSEEKRTLWRLRMDGIGPSESKRNRM